MKSGRSIPVALLSVLIAVHLGGCDWFVSAEQRIARAEQKVAQGDDRGALIELQNAVQSQPDNVPARLLLADISLRLGEPKAAQKELLDATARGATPHQTADVSARVRLALGEGDTLLKEIDGGDSVLEEPARSTYRGLAMLAAQNAPEALDAFQVALAKQPGFSRARLGHADALAALGRVDEAVHEIDALVADEPSNATAWMSRGLLMTRRGDPAAAVIAYGEARKHFAGQLSMPQQLALLGLTAESQLMAGKTEDARATHAELAKRAPNAALTQLLTARIAMADQNYVAAATAAQQAVSAVPELMQAKLLLGAALLYQGNLNQAEAHLSDVVRQDPSNLQARKLLAQANLRMQRPDIAMQVLAPVQLTEAKDAQFDALLGWANLQKGDSAAGVALLERSVQADPANVSLRLDLAAAYVSTGEHEKAIALIEALPADQQRRRRDTLLVAALAAGRGSAAARNEIERIVAANPRDPDVLNMAAAFYGREKDLDRARELLRKVATLDPKNASAQINLARLEIAAGNDKAARDVLEKALSLAPSNQVDRFALAQIAQRLGDETRAITLLEESRTADAKAVEPRLLLGRIYLQQAKTTQADKAIGEAITVATDRATAEMWAGRLYMEAGRFEAALQHFQKASDLQPGHAEHLVNVAQAQLSLSNEEGARRAIDSALRADPQSIPAHALSAMLDVRAGRGAEALQRISALRAARQNDVSMALLEGDVALSVQSYAVAVRAFDSAMRLQPSAAAAIGAYRARRVGKLPDATAPLTHWLESNPADMATRMVLADNYASSGANALAIGEYEKIAAAAQPNPVALNNLAWLYEQKGDARAITTAQRAYQAAPKLPAIADTYGWLLVKAGRIQEALPILEQAASASEQPEIRYHYAHALATSGEKSRARAELTKLLSRSAGSIEAEARKLLGQLDGG